MAKRKFGAKVGGKKWYRSWQPSKKSGLGGWDEGDFVVGTIVGFELDKKFKRTNYHLKVEEKNFEVEDKEGNPLEEGGILVLNGSGKLAKVLGCLTNGDTELSKGKVVCITYEGQSEITSGDWEGSMANDISVQFEEDDSSDEDCGEDDL